MTHPRKAGNKPGIEAGIYVALPFCPSHCHYCSNPAARYSPAATAAYTQRVGSELQAAAPAWREHRIRTVYVGGGTPTLFEPAQIRHILDTIRQHFDLAPDAEITSEANPETVSLSTAEGFLQAGVNRISIGAQSFQPRHLAALGRIHTPERVGEAVATARAAGFRNLSLDLIFAQPGQTLDEWRDDLEHALSLNPEHVSAYGLTVEEGTQLWVRVQTGSVSPPDADSYDAFYATTVERLLAGGLERYEVSNFARPCRACLHNQGYWRGGDYLGVGAGAASHQGGHRYGQTGDVQAYLGQPPGFHPMQEAERLSPRERAHEMAVFGLRTAEGISLAAIRRHTGVDLSTHAADSFERLIATGLLSRSGDRVFPTDRGFLFASTVGVALAHLPDD
ncbi:MAG: radical SAM family heme chaperone HemW [Nitrospirota bacterium]|nr:radical SAM family heme chaperone HemW [Nitrospirota bacterium]